MLKFFLNQLRNSSSILNSIKIAFVITLIPYTLLVYYIYYSGDSEYYEYIFPGIFILLGFSYIVYPYIYDYSELAKHVKNLSLNRPVTTPKFKTSIAIAELSDSLEVLRKSWNKTHFRLQQKINESSLLFDTIPDMIIMLNEDLAIIQANNAANHTFGNNLIGKNLEDIINDPAIHGCIRWVMHDKNPKEIELSLVSNVIKEYQVKINLFTVDNKDNCFILLVFHDITEAKRSEKTFSDFIANASHEIRTPLTTIIGIIETLQTTAKNDKKALAAFLPMIETQANRMKSLINDLLSLADVEKNLTSTPTEFINILEVLELVEKQVEWQLLNNKNTLIKNIDVEAPKIIGDFQQLTQVFYNLVTNAIKYGHPNTNITIKVQIVDNFSPKFIRNNTTKQALIVSVIDQGDGIPPQYIERLTERFFRVDKSRSNKVGGTGLGLAIVKQILTRHDAYLQIDSTQGIGSSFSVFFPIPQNTE
jgi:two-component system phosphate regulon sensor histidine kinase PhoR